MNSLPTIDGLDLRLVLSHVDDLAGAVAGRPELGGLAKFDQAAAAAEALRFRALGRELEARLAEAETVARSGEAGEAMEILLRAPSVPLMGRCLDGLGAERIATWDAWCAAQGLPASGVTLRSEWELEDDPESRQWTDEAGAAFRRLAGWPRLAEWLKQARELPGEARDGYGEALAEARAARDRGDEEACGENLARALAAAEALALLEEPPEEWRDRVAELRHGLLPAWVARCLSEGEPEDAPALAALLLNTTAGLGVPLEEIRSRLGPGDAALVTHWGKDLATEMEVELEQAPGGEGSSSPSFEEPFVPDLPEYSVKTPPPIPVLEPGWGALGGRGSSYQLHLPRPRHSRPKKTPTSSALLKVSAGTITLLVLSVIVFQGWRMQQDARKRDHAQLITGIQEDLRRGDYERAEARVWGAKQEAPVDATLDEMDQVLAERRLLKEHLQAVALSKPGESLPGLGAPLTRNDPDLAALRQWIGGFSPLQGRPTGSAQEDLAAVSRWLAGWQSSQSIGGVCDNLGVVEEARKANEAVIARARSWVGDYGRDPSAESRVALQQLLREDHAAAMFPELRSNLEGKPSVAIRQPGTVVATPIPRPSAMVPEAKPGPISASSFPTKASSTTGPSEAIEVINLLIEKPDSEKTFAVPKAFGNSRGGEIEVPFEKAVFSHGQLWLPVAAFKDWLKSAGPVTRTRYSLLAQGRTIGSFSSEADRFRCVSSRPFALWEDGRVRLFSILPGLYQAESITLSGRDELNPAEYLPLDAPWGELSLSANRGGGAAEVKISLPLAAGGSLPKSLAEGFRSSLENATKPSPIREGAQLFRQWFWDPSLTGTGGLLEGIQGLKGEEDSKYVGFLKRVEVVDNSACALGLVSEEFPKGRTKIDAFVIEVPKFQSFIDSSYGRSTPKGMDTLVAGFLSKLSRALYDSKDPVTTRYRSGSGPTRYFPWGHDVFLIDVSKRVELKQIVRDFDTLLAGKARGFEVATNAMTSDRSMELAQKNHQLLKQKLEELAKVLGKIQVFLDWGDLQFPDRNVPIQKRFELAMTEAQKVTLGKEDQEFLARIESGDLTGLTFMVEVHP